MMTPPAIRHIAVLGSGVMGSAIAAHAANAGAKVTLLDIVPQGAENRNILTGKAVERMLAASPSPFLSPERAKAITCGNLEDDMGLLIDADWIIEAVLEKREVKQDVYRKVDAVRKKGSVLSSNTSTLPLHELVDGLPAHIAQDFMIAHFFNPPRFMRLLEVVKGNQTRPEAFDAVAQFADIHLGKEIVPCKDTPGFIANRIGVYWMFVGLAEALRLGISVEEADAVMGKPVGIPRTGVFGLFDLIGLDLMPLIANAMLHSLPANDAFRALDTEPALLKKLIAEGYTGRKGKGGFTRIRKEGEKKIKETLDLKTGEYRAEAPAQLESAKAKNINALLAGDDSGARYAWAVLSKTLHYAASLLPEIANDIVAVDAAMTNGYNWKAGPFALIDAIGTEAFAKRLQADGLSIPPLLHKAAGRPLYRTEGSKAEYLTLQGNYAPIPRPPGVLLLADATRAKTPVLQNGSARLWDIGDGIACLELATKMNAIDNDIISLIEETLARLPQDFRGLVIGGDAEHFSAGANLSYFLSKAESGNWAAIETIIRNGQQAFMRLKYAPFPTVAALAGLALGGGCELALHSNHVQAHAECAPGLVEVNVGLIPAWGGCKEMLLRQPDATTAFNLILSAKTAGSADDARAMRVLRATDKVSMNRARLLADAKARCMALSSGYTPPAAGRISVPSDTKAMFLQVLEEKSAAGKLSPHDRVIGEALAIVLSANGKTESSETDILALELAGFMELVKTSASLERIRHMLNTGKPLKN